MVSKIAFALGWVLLIYMSLMPDSLAMEITMALLVVLFIISSIMCVMEHGKLSAIFYEISRNKLLDIVPSLAWIAGMITVSVTDDSVIKESIGNVATVILVVGLVLYPSPQVEDDL
ncbi:MAG: hypothetical protein K2J65_05010 [Duncaniella sp.]|nr:hypothetical protein [Duncaniella sp.]